MIKKISFLTDFDVVLIFSTHLKSCVRLTITLERKYAKCIQKSMQSYSCLYTDRAVSTF